MYVPINNPQGGGENISSFSTLLHFRLHYFLLGGWHENINKNIRFGISILLRGRLLSYGKSGSHNGVE
jgi:hypothetical protein